MINREQFHEMLTLICDLTVRKKLFVEQLERGLHNLFTYSNEDDFLDIPFISDHLNTLVYTLNKWVGLEDLVDEFGTTLIEYWVYETDCQGNNSDFEGITMSSDIDRLYENIVRYLENKNV